jgi:hypothetical protein
MDFGEAQKRTKQDKHWPSTSRAFYLIAGLSSTVHRIYSINTLSMAAVRLRKAFRYPEDSDENREELDEEEQEQLIEQLHRQNHARNAQYHVNIELPATHNLYFLASKINHRSNLLLDHLHEHSVDFDDCLLAFSLLGVKSGGMALVALGSPLSVSHGLYDATVSFASRS